MAESRRGCTPAQQSMCSSNPLAFTSRLSAVVAELLISRHAPCHKHLFLVQKFYSRRTPRDYRENHRNSCEKAGIPANSFSTREGRSAGAVRMIANWLTIKFRSAANKQTQNHHVSEMPLMSKHMPLMGWLRLVGTFKL